MKWAMPEWMEQFCGTYLYEKNEVERLMNTKTNVLVNAPLSLECVSMESKVRLLEKLYKDGLLTVNHFDC
ncbi:hypothetical protein EDM57_04915 [Brevibacillus gelatini]|uniref:Uncharacterized protein n=2 Tax=Brevibacillus gelatini TaxID=1655277 RepID=A0A3M8B7X9_9BACL|nr:hypothetical protein EDM57_04915 [Brevibacillus gelatini]